MIQAWPDKQNPGPWKNMWDNGHYVILVAMDFVLIGILVGAGAIPAALVAWLTAGDRY